jgi:tetratricopeptide (TPR) repeat protein
MRLLPWLACLIACAEWRLQPTFPAAAAGLPVIHEQALLGLSPEGDAAVAQLVDADGQPPELALLAFDRAGGPSRTLLLAPEEIAAAVSRRVREQGHRSSPVLAEAVVLNWPEATKRARELGFFPRTAARPDADLQTFPLHGAASIGELPLALRVAVGGEEVALLLGDGGGDEVELARINVPGTPLAQVLWIEAGVAWLLGGSVQPGEPLHRAAGLRRAIIARGEAQLHRLHGLEDRAASDLDAAGREFARSIACDPEYVDGLYDGAATAARRGDADEAVALLRRAAAVDPGRVQVLGRDDVDLRALRQRADVRILLGLRRLPPDDERR